MTAVYLGARFDRRSQFLGQIVPPLQSSGHIITSSWLNETPGTSVLGMEELTKRPALGVPPALACLQDIDRADQVVIFTIWPSSTGGYDVELGYALGKHKPLTIVGPRRNVFQALPHLHHETIGDFLAAWTRKTAGRAS